MIINWQRAICPTKHCSHVWSRDRRWWGCCWGAVLSPPDSVTSVRNSTVLLRVQWDCELAVAPLPQWWGPQKASPGPSRPAPTPQGIIGHEKTDHAPSPQVLLHLIVFLSLSLQNGFLVWEFVFPPFKRPITHFELIIWSKNLLGGIQNLFCKTRKHRKVSHFNFLNGFSVPSLGRLFCNWDGAWLGRNQIRLFHFIFPFFLVLFTERSHFWCRRYIGQVKIVYFVALYLVFPQIKWSNCSKLSWKTKDIHSDMLTKATFGRNLPRSWELPRGAFIFPTFTPELELTPEFLLSVTLFCMDNRSKITLKTFQHLNLCNYIFVNHNYCQPFLKI